MKRILSLLLCLVLVVGAVCAVGAAGDDQPQSAFLISMPVRFRQTEARKLLQMVNDFRTGSDAWYWNNDDTTKFSASGLKTLSYDYELEQIAMQRAAELALQFSHTRPNGKLCFDAYGERNSAAENIAAGQKSAQEVHDDWREDNEPYLGQGHRRNLLSADVEAVGFGCVEYGGMTYWAEAFGKPASSAAPTAALDAEVSVTIEIDPSQLTVYEVRLSETKMELTVSTTQALPAAALRLRLNEGLSDVILTPQVDWVSSDPSVAAVDKQMLFAAGPGNCTLKGSVFDNPVSVPVSVRNKAPAEPTEPTTQEPETEPTTPSPTEQPTTHTHVPEILPPVTPTCLTTGLTAGSRCKECGEILEKQKTVPMLAHAYTTKLTRARYQKAGKVVSTCSMCGKRETRVIPAVASIRLTGTKYIYDGRRHTPKVRIMDEAGKKLQRNVDYKLTYPAGRRDVGDYRIRIQFIGDYKGTKSAEYKILPGKVTKLTAKPGVKSAALSWNAVPGATDYIVYYSETEKGGYRMLGSTTKTSASMVRLDAKKVYYFRVRAVASVDDKQWNGAMSAAVRVVAK
ncbi:MAG: hypothetical protein II804_00865 [Clostridia bacterium]|nr:hypothetical protein [Clostridia bacterium]